MTGLDARDGTDRAGATVPVSSSGRRVGVFGSARVAESSFWFAEAERLGALLAGAGFDVVTRGYGGLMAAVSRGAAEAGGATHGLPVRTWDQAPNEWLTTVSWAPDSYEQLRMFGDCVALVALEGGASTLAEVAFAWANPAISPAVVLVGSEWEHLFEAFRKWLVVDRSDLDLIHVLDTVDDVVPTLERLLTGRAPVPPRRHGRG